VPIIKPAQKHEYNTETVQLNRNETLNRQNENSVSDDDGGGDDDDNDDDNNNRYNNSKTYQ
jgi:hypothetical protein